MTGRIVNLHADRCREVQSLLPWYVSGQLEAEEHTQAEAHLADCAECRSELAFDRKLSQAIDALPTDVEQGWAMMRRRLAEPDVRRRGWAPRPAWIGWALAAQLTLVALGGFVLMQARSTDSFHTLGSPPAAAAGNLVVIFRPDASESAIRAALLGAKARVVDGPTAAGAYVLQVAPLSRGGVVRQLKTSTAVVLAEPIDAARP